MSNYFLAIIDFFTPHALAVFSGEGDVKGGIAKVLNQGTSKNLDTLICDFTTTAISYVGLLAVVTIIIAGFYLLLSLGSDDSKKKAKNIITYTIYGLITITFAGFIVSFISSITGNQFSTGCAPLGISSAQNAKIIISSIVKNLLSYVALIGVITIIIAGFILMFGQGSDDSKKKAKNIILYTIIGLAIIVFSRVLYSVIINFLLKVNV